MSNPVNYNSRFHSKEVLNPRREPVPPTQHTENKVNAMGPRLSNVCDPELRKNPRFASVRAPSPKRAEVQIKIGEKEFDYINDDENDSMAIAKIRDLLAELLEGPATELPTKTESAMTFSPTDEDSLSDISSLSATIQGNQSSHALTQLGNNTLSETDEEEALREQMAAILKN